MTTNTARTMDVTKPPKDWRLAISVIASDLGVSVREMAKAAAISPAAMSDIITKNRWPVRTPRQRIENALRAFFTKQGASTDQVESLFHALVRRRQVLASAPNRTAPVSTQAPEKATPTQSPQNPEVHEMLLPKQILTPTARKQFRLFLNPFDGEVTDAAMMFNSPDIAFVRECCLQAAVGGRFVALIGESGAGKTTLQADLETRIASDSRRIIVIKPSVLGMDDKDSRGHTFKSTDILAAIITTLDPMAALPQSLEARSRLVTKLLTQSAQTGYLHLLMIEEAHSMPDATLRHLKRLHELKFERRPLLGILLLAQPELAKKLDPARPDLREVTQRCEIVQLEPLGQDLVPYLEHRCHWVERKLADFTELEAVEELRRRLTVKRAGSAGSRTVVSLLYPLAVNNAMTYAMNLAASIGAPIVTADVVRAM